MCEVGRDVWRVVRGAALPLQGRPSSLRVLNLKLETWNLKLPSVDFGLWTLDFGLHSIFQPTRSRSPLRGSSSHQGPQPRSARAFRAGTNRGETTSTALRCRC